MCAHIAPLVRAGLPIDRGLKALVAELPTRLGNVALEVQRGLENGEPLFAILAKGERPESRSLSSTIAAGECSNALAEALESWASLQTVRAQATMRFRLRMVYPLFLILVTVSAITYCIRGIVPQYRSNLESIHSRIPLWFHPIEWVHANLFVLAAMIALASISPILFLIWRRSSFDRLDWPRDAAYRLRLQSHAAFLAERMAASELSTGRMVELAIGSLGTKELAGGMAPLIGMAPLMLDPTVRSILELLGQGHLEKTRAIGMLSDCAQLLRDRSDAEIESQGRWISYAVSVSVAIAVGGTYLLVVYLPWLYLLDQLQHFKLIS